jgi:hypothetical protein
VKAGLKLATKRDSLNVFIFVKEVELNDLEANEPKAF